MPTARVRDGSPSRCTVNVCWVGEQVSRWWSISGGGAGGDRREGAPTHPLRTPPPRVSASLTPHGLCLGML